MNGDTITVNAHLQNGPRVKRIKIEQTATRDNPNRGDLNQEQRYSNGNVERGKVETVNTTEINGNGKDTLLGLNAEVQTQRPIQPVPAGFTALGVQRDREPSTPSTVPSPVTAGLLNQDDLGSITPKINFSSAPSEPIELAWWVAQQVAHFHEERAVSAELETQEGQRRSSVHPPGIHARLSDGHLDASQIANREKLRGENRERKKRWRESNTERNKDNDLKCRINKRAKTKFGADSSAEKAAYIETEFNKRRDKREKKQRARVIEAGEFPSFVIAAELGDRIFSSQNPELSSDVQDAGNLLMNALFGVRSNGNKRAASEAAAALKTTLVEGTLEPKPFIEALKVMATNAELMKGISSELHYSGDDDEVEALSGEDNGSYPPHPVEPHIDATTPQDSSPHGHSAEIIKSLNAATALFNSIADNTAYASPYGNPPPATTGLNGSGNGKITGSETLATKNSAGEHGLDQASIDALLALANGGSLTDDEDDKTIADPDELNAQQIDLSALPQTDIDITATLQCVINQMMAERNGGQKSSDALALSMGKLVSDPYGSPSLQDQLAALQTHLTRASVSVNTIIPAVQGHATSQLYTQLSNRARSSTPSGGINPAHASSFGTTAQMQQRMLARPGIFGSNQHQQQHPLQAADSPSRGNVGLPTRTRNQEEMRKIKSYGFPPLPGSRPGAQKKT
ncbi:hypothetical protein MMC13_000399 [Lambiella insularis]|nr:hypothetical protein [Lambiella insularis]